METSNQEKDDNLSALKGLFRWLESITKQKEAKERIHVFMSSSEQFFLRWVEGLMQNKCEVIQIVDLPKIQAQEFFEIKKGEYGIEKCKISFDQLYQLTGCFKK